MDVVLLHRRAVAEFGARVREVGSTDWSRPTPCPGWDARDLVNHLVGENLWTVPLLEGATLAEVGDRFDGDVLGGEPHRAWQEAAGAAQAAVAAPGALERLVHLSAGLTPASEYVMQLSADHLVHAWDLAVAVGADRRLPDELVAVCARWFEGREEAYRQAGIIGPRRAAGDDADPQSLLLAAFGRDAGGGAEQR